MITEASEAAQVATDGRERTGGGGGGVVDESEREGR